MRLATTQSESNAWPGPQPEQSSMHTIGTKHALLGRIPKHAARLRAKEYLAVMKRILYVALVAWPIGCTTPTNDCPAGADAGTPCNTNGMNGNQPGICTIDTSSGTPRLACCSASDAGGCSEAG